VVDVAVGRRIPSLAVGHFEESGRQPLASDLDPGQARLDSGYVLIGKAHVGRAEVFLHAVQAAGAEDRQAARYPAQAARRTAAGTRG
jgi:hypothetical protein